MKVDGPLGSLVQGVSQQAPTERRQGQHGAQVNMLADPVRGLSRRHGTIWQAEQDLSLNAANAAANLIDSGSFRSFDYTNNDRDLTVLYRSGPKVAGSDMPALIVYDKTNKQFLTLVRNGTDALLDALVSGGVSAITSVGKYVFMAGNSIVPSGTSTNTWASDTNQRRTVLWVRGGAYRRTYSATVTKPDNTQVSFSYKTPTSSYPGTLDTSGVSVWIPDTTGSSAGSGPTLATADEVIGVATNGGTFTVANAGSSPQNFVVSYQGVFPGVGGDSGFDIPYQQTLVRGADYTESGGTITWLRNINEPGLHVTYQYTTGGTSATVVYATESTTESAYIKNVNGVGVTSLIYKDWEPASLTVRNNAEALTNVYPAQPTSPSEFSWIAGGKEVIFHVSLVGSVSVTITYTHTKTVANPNYAKQVTDITNEYNSAVTKWIGTSSAAIQPEAIAASLAAAATTAGLTGVSVVGSTVVFTDIKDITSSDGGDGTLLKGLANNATSIDDLTDAHHVGKLVRISPTGGEAFYMKATAKNSAITSGVTEVLWIEGAGVDRTIDSALCYGVADGNTFYVAGSATLLNAILPGDHPTYKPATVGDDDSSPMPFFVGRKISYLGVFQDRLAIGSGAVIRCSMIGDYLNFFRSTVLTEPGNDPLEMLSQGSEDDTIRFGALYDRDLYLFGKRQYAVSGRVALTPTNANMPVVSTHEGADDARPVPAGSLIFYAKQGQAAVSVHQIEPGRNPESPESYPASSQLDDYMAGDPVDLTVVPKPSNLLVRTSGARNSLFVYSYLDTNERRVQDCWNRWDYAPALGPTLGATVVREGVIVFTLRQAVAADSSLKHYAVADLQPLDGQLSTRPYLDSARPWLDVVDTPGSLHENSTDFSAAYGSGSNSFLLGVDDLADVPALIEDQGDADKLWVGKQYTAYWQPTNPMPRNGDGVAVENGRMTVTSLLVAFRNSSGFRSIVTFQGNSSEFSFNGRILGDVNNRIGRVPVSTGKQSVIVGRAFQEYEQTIYAHTWLPLNITSVSWTGQLFHRAQQR